MLERGQKETEGSRLHKTMMTTSRSFYCHEEVDVPFCCSCQRLSYVSMSESEDLTSCKRETSPTDKRKVSDSGPGGWDVTTRRRRLCLSARREAEERRVLEDDDRSGGQDHQPQVPRGENQEATETRHVQGALRGLPQQPQEPRHVGGKSHFFLRHLGWARTGPLLPLGGECYFLWR